MLVSTCELLLLVMVVLVSHMFFGFLCFGILSVIREFLEVVCWKLMCAVCAGKVSSVCNRSQYTVG